MIEITLYSKTDKQYREIMSRGGRGICHGKYYIRADEPYLDGEFNFIVDWNKDHLWDEMSLQIMREFDNAERIEDFRILIDGRKKNITELSWQCKFALISWYYKDTDVTYILEKSIVSTKLWEFFCTHCDVKLIVLKQTFQLPPDLQADISIDGEVFLKNEMQKLYTSRWNSYRYDWKKDIENIIDYIEEKREQKWYFMYPSWEGTLSEFLECINTANINTTKAKEGETV